MGYPSQVCHVDTIRSIVYSSITNSYKDVGSSFGHPMRIIRLVNTTDEDMMISFDGVSDNLILPAGSFILYDLTTNREENTNFFVFTIGTQVFVKYISEPSKGSVYVECLYGKGE